MEMMDKQNTDIVNQDIKHEHQRERAQNLGVPLADLREVDELVKKTRTSRNRRKAITISSNRRI